MSQVRSIFPKPIFLGSATRSPIGKFGGSLKRFSASELAALCLKEAHKRSASDAPVDLVVLGHARQAGARPNPARQATLFSGLSESVPAITVNQACASGLASVLLASDQIALGRAKRIFAGGVESMSNTPYLLMPGRFGLRMGNTEILDGMTQDGFFCPMAGMLMGATVEEFIAKELQISRSEQDEYAVLSQTRAERSWNEGLFLPETFVIPGDGKSPDFREDEHRRAGTTSASLVKLAPVFDPKSGSVTAGNSSGITDGSAFLEVTADRTAASQVELLDSETIALDPKRMGLGPIEATLRLLRRQGISISDLDFIELNEAFAAQVIACLRGLKTSEGKVNLRGGAIAIGHPIGATGTRILVTLIHQMLGKPGSLGLATLCVSGGQGVSVLLRSL